MEGGEGSLATVLPLALVLEFEFVESLLLSDDELLVSGPLDLRPK